MQEHHNRQSLEVSAAPSEDMREAPGKIVQLALQPNGTVFGAVCGVRKLQKEWLLR